MEDSQIGNIAELIYRIFLKRHKIRMIYFDVVKADEEIHGRNKPTVMGMSE